MSPSRQQPKKKVPATKSKEAPPVKTGQPEAAGFEAINAWPHLDVPGQQHLLLQLQESHGNQFAQRFLVNSGVDIAIQRAGTTPSGPTKATQEAQAKKSTKRIRKIMKDMLTDPDPRVANTARLIGSTGSKFARLDFKAMTVRSDNAALKAKAGPSAAGDEFFFYGLKQDDKHRKTKFVAGTVTGGKTLLIRNIDTNNILFSKASIISFIVHEVSHLLVESYKDFPKSDTDAGSKDRYKDEFRAYWVETDRPWALSSGKKKAHAIRDHMLGTTKTTTGGYSDLKVKYWNAKDTSFKNFVDNYLKPEGYNLDHNPNLDRLTVLVQGVKKSKSKFNGVLAHISKHMSPSERSEAVSNNYFARGKQAFKSLGEERWRRVRISLLSYKYNKVAKIIDDIKAGKSKFEVLQMYIVRSLSPAEAADVAGNDYFGKGGEAFKILGAKNHKRMMTSLAFLKHKKIAKGLNPSRDRKMGYFLSAIAIESENAIKVNY